MDSLLNRYRNITVLLLVIFAQLVLLAYQVKSNRDVRLIRVWAISAVTPFARVVEGVRGGTVGALDNYVFLHNLGEENRKLKSELDKLKLENQYLKSQLETADRLKALSTFEAQTPSKMIGARIIGTGSGGSSKLVFLDRGSNSGVMRGMAVVTADGIVGKITGVYPTASQVLLVTDPSFAAGVISQKHRVHGTLKGQGHSVCIVDYVPNEEKVELGELFYTSGDDGVFPKGFVAGRVTSVRPGRDFQQIMLTPSGPQNGLEEVLIVLEGVHAPIPEIRNATTPVYVQPAPPEEQPKKPAPEATGTGAAQPPAPALTEADRLRQRYEEIGEAQNHRFGYGLPGSKPPDFNLKIVPGAKPPAAKPAVPGAKPAAPNAPAAPAATPAAKPPAAATTKPAASQEQQAVRKTVPQPKPAGGAPAQPAPAQQP